MAVAVVRPDLRRHTWRWDDPGLKESPETVLAQLGKLQQRRELLRVGINAREGRAMWVVDDEELRIYWRPVTEEKKDGK